MLVKGATGSYREWVGVLIVTVQVNKQTLTQGGLVTPYGHIDRSQHWFRYRLGCLTTPNHYLNRC